jgi:hypothetical protein
MKIAPEITALHCALGDMEFLLDGVRELNPNNVGELDEAWGNFLLAYQAYLESRLLEAFDHHLDDIDLPPSLLQASLIAELGTTQ